MKFSWKKNSYKNICDNFTCSYREKERGWREVRSSFGGQPVSHHCSAPLVAAENDGAIIHAANLIVQTWVSFFWRGWGICVTIRENRVTFLLLSQLIQFKWKKLKDILMLEFCLVGCLNTNRKPCSEFPVTCKGNILFLPTYRKKWTLMSKYYQNKHTTYIVKVSSYFTVSAEYSKEGRGGLCITDLELDGSVFNLHIWCQRNCAYLVTGEINTPQREAAQFSMKCGSAWVRCGWGVRKLSLIPEARKQSLMERYQRCDTG